MTTSSHEPVCSPAPTVGLVASVAALACSVAYVLAQLAEWAGWLGSAGGPHASSTALGLAVLLTPSLLLASAYLVVTVCLHEVASAARRVWSLAAIAFATMYAALVSTVYFVQLTLVAPRLGTDAMAELEFLRFVPFESFLYAVDLLGYGFMCVSTLFAALALDAGPVASATRRALLANGLLLPFLALQMYWPELVYGGALWALTFPAASVGLALYFRGRVDDVRVRPRPPAAASNAAAT